MQRSPNRHVLVRLRRELGGMTQSEFARLVNASRPTIQGVELLQIPLSERLAHQISRVIGVDVEWLLQNKLNEPPRTRDGRLWNQKAFHLAQQGAFRNDFLDKQPLIILLRIYNELRVIVGNRNFPQLIKDGSMLSFQKAVLDLWETVPDPEERQQLFQRYRERKPSDEELLKQVISDARDCLRALQDEQDRQAKEERIWAEIKARDSSRKPCSAPVAD
jgi:transcriptional regulator with XRE-family HTH domain